jgi:hypothetical protein
MCHACISEDKKGAAHIRFNYDIFLAKFTETNWIFEFLLENIQFQKKKSSETESGK